MNGLFSDIQGTDLFENNNFETFQEIDYLSCLSDDSSGSDLSTDDFLDMKHSPKGRKRRKLSVKLENEKTIFCEMQDKLSQPEGFFPEINPTAFNPKIQLPLHNNPIIKQENLKVAVSAPIVAKPISKPKVVKKKVVKVNKRKRKRGEMSKSNEIESAKKTKDEMRRKKNRESARASRERKKKYITELETCNQSLTKKNFNLMNDNRLLLAENQMLREQIRRLCESKGNEYNSLEPIPKRRKVYFSEMKPVEVPMIQSQNGPSGNQQPMRIPMNPFSSNFWQMVLPHPTVPGNKAVIMFMIVFCLAFFACVPKQTEMISNNAGNNEKIAQITGRKLLDNENKETLANIRKIYTAFEKRFDRLETQDTMELSPKLLFDILNIEIEKEKGKYLFLEMPHNLETDVLRKKRRRTTSSSNTFENITKNLLCDICSEFSTCFSGDQSTSLPSSGIPGVKLEK